MNREQFELLIRNAYMAGLEDGMSEVPPAHGWRPDHASAPEYMWQLSESKKLVDRWFPPTVELAPPPYPFCHSPKECAGKGYCTRDPACNN